MKPLRALAAIAVLLLIPSAGSAAIVPVSIVNNTFDPADVTIQPGDTVRWTWVNGIHSTTSDTNIWDSGQVGPPFMFDFTFPNVGNFPYYCSIHGAPGGIGMAGIVRVQTSTATPTQTPTPTPTPTVTPVPTPEAFHSAAPCRVVDTRNADGPVGGPALQAGAERAFPFRGQCGIPATARSVSINVTVTASTAPGHLRIYPGGTAPPLVSAINYQAGQTRANNAIFVLGQQGSLAVFCGQAAGTVHLIADVNGWFE